MNTKRNLRAVLCLAIGTAISLATNASAQDYPTKPIRLLVPFPPGGPTDLVARVMAEKLGQALGQPLVIDSRPGAGGVVAAGAAAKSAPDGYTLFFATNSTFVAHPFLMKDLPFDSEKDFAPISFVASVPLILIVPGKSPVKTLNELIALGKAKAGQVNYGTAGLGGAAHLTNEMFNMAAGTKFIHVPYKGGPFVMTAAMSGEIDMAFASLTDAIPLVRSGKLRALGVTAAQRSQSATEVPTMAEAGMAMVAETWLGLVGPAGTPRRIIDRVQRENVRVMKSPEVSQRMLALGAVAAPGTPEEFAAYIKTERSRWSEVIRSTGVKIE